MGYAHAACASGLQCGLCGSSRAALGAEALLGRDLAELALGPQLLAAGL